MKDRMITLATYGYSRAQLLKTRLESEGVECFLKNLNLIQSAVGGGVKLRIRAQDLAQALEIIEELELSYAQEDFKKSFPRKKIDVNRILVPIDFSDFSPRLCEYAMSIAKTFNADILLFHTYFASAIETIPFSDSYTYNATVVEVLSEVEKNAKARIKELYYDIRNKLELEQVEGIEVDYALSGGTASSEILNICNTYQPDLVIMGSRGESAGTTNLLGSVVSNVIEESKVPILVLSDQGEDVSLEQIRNIMYATNFDKADFRAIANLKFITKPYDIKVHCVHFNDIDDDNVTEQHQMEVLRKYLDKTLGDSNVNCSIIQFEEKMKGIEEYVQKNDIGMIAILARKHNLLERLFFGQMSRKLFIKTHIPILVFH
ncbi:universal stress protein [Labilibaculum sp. K2S]|uniref:universal stress protein n=1 Tax=Labilibaculum sp. K2S TaxID=3056386 RepID=UPI0025A46BBC|nr:universal stress protein [Labilibaculum sp. K2S]MDM8158734.1 universal stress protein [Labilibaculum sp. K2S]